jgi:glycosyltransferase involved in cell wall biosynthesis
MKSLLGILVLNRPKAFEQCITHLRTMDERDDVEIIVVDNGSNDETKEMIYKYQGDIDLIMHNPWNYGYCFGVNSWMALRKPEQHCIQIDQDLIMHSQNWWTLSKLILADADIGMVSARRPTAWIERQEKRDFYPCLKFEQRHGLWLEIPPNNLLIAPILMYKGSLLDEMGFENEMTNYGDLESYLRVWALGFKSVYIPDIFLYQLENNAEGDSAPLRSAHVTILKDRQALHQECVKDYLIGKNIYRGTRFRPETIVDPAYKRLSDENFEFFKNWKHRSTNHAT